MNSGTSQTFGAEFFKHAWQFQMNYLFSPHVLVPLALSMFLAEHVTGKFRFVVLVVPG